MISETTLAQIASLQLRPKRPLVICDVDEVVVHFTRDFEGFLRERGLALDPQRMLFIGNIRNLKSKEFLNAEESEEVVVQFFEERTLDMETIDGAVESLHSIGKSADVIMLTNLPHEAGDHRRKNLESSVVKFL